ncbi:DNA-binding transcriptional regulator BolA-like [Babylonia areolata]|uniref:DNA-binding transcriptional regulator BolA-like n=1 Tax=Babylonia areolata TaxID=304850 RepID=UPI003FD68CCE
MAKAVTICASRIVRPAILQNCLHPQLKAVHYSSSIMNDILKPLESSIKKKLTDTFKPTVLQIVNESYMHNVPKGSETHFKVVVVSDSFEGASLVQRHRLVNTTLAEEFASGLHALSIVAKTPEPVGKVPSDGWPISSLPRWGRLSE